MGITVSIVFTVMGFRIGHSRRKPVQTFGAAQHRVHWMGLSAAPDVTNYREIILAGGVVRTTRPTSNASPLGNPMRILVACEFSGVVREAFSALGHESWSCDLLPTEIPGNHYQGDIRDILHSGWDLMVAHPPCTRLCNSGVRWLAERNLWQEMREAAEFFKLILKAPIKKKAIENPIPHKYAVEIIGRKYDQIIQPHQFGHGETKATCLWLENLDELQPTNQVEGREQRIHFMSPGANRSHERSRFFPGIANAMAAQWAGCLTQRAPDSLKAAVLSLPEIVKVENALPAVSG